MTFRGRWQLAALDCVDDQFNLSVLGRLTQTGCQTQLRQVDRGSAWKLGTLRYQVPLVTDCLRAELVVPSDSQKPCLFGARRLLPGACARFIPICAGDGHALVRYDGPCVERCCARVHRACGFGRNHCPRLWRSLPRKWCCGLVHVARRFIGRGHSTRMPPARGQRIQRKSDQRAHPAPNPQSKPAAPSSEVFRRRHRQEPQYPPRRAPDRAIREIAA